MSIHECSTRQKIVFGLFALISSGGFCGSMVDAVAEEVELTLKVTTLAGKRVQLSGTTNLPSGTALMLSVQETVENGFYGQSRCTVSAKGIFESELFGPKNGLHDGLYVANVTMPIPRVQPPEIRAIIGENGEKLSGMLVRKDILGTSVSQSVKFSVGGSAAAEAQEERARKAQVDSEKLRRELCVLLEQLLEFTDKPQFKEYGFAIGGPYNAWLKRAQTLWNDQPTGQHLIPFELRIAAGDLLTLGLSYLGKKDTEYARRMLPELKETIGYEEYLKRKKTDILTTNEPAYRTWRDATGKFNVEASLVSVKKKVVNLKKQDGSIINVPLERLSVQDQLFVEQNQNAAMKLMDKIDSLMGIEQLTAEQASKFKAAADQHTVEKKESKSQTEKVYFPPAPPTRVLLHAESGTEIVGTWQENSGFRRQITIYRQNARTFAKELYRDGSNGTTELIEVPSGGGIRFHDKSITPANREAGSHWFLNGAGELEFRDNDGVYDKGTPVR